ncbi:14056_t:CDS:1, partial [Gigaspora margarita]
MQKLCPGILFLIIGTKIDLQDDERPITSEQGRKLAQELGAIKYLNA